jgi:RHS Repeat.
MRCAVACFLCLSAALAYCEDSSDPKGEERVERLDSSKGYRELVYRSDALTAERFFDSQGALLEEKLYGPDSLPYETRSYLRSGGRLLGVEARNASGEIVGSMRYRYDRDGRLLGLDSEGSFGEGGAGMIASSSGPKSSWTQDGLTTILSYDAEGRAVTLRSSKDGEAQTLEKRSYGEGGALKSVSIQDKAKGKDSELAYDAEGRLTLKKERSGSGPENTTSYRYDKDGRLVDETSRQGAHKSRISRSYAADGSIARVETSIDGELVLAVENVEGGRIEELYDEGQLFVRASYAGGRKVKDEFFVDGQLVRTRDYR